MTNNGTGRGQPLLGRYLSLVETGIRSLIFRIGCYFKGVRVEGLPRINGMQPMLQNRGTCSFGTKVRFRSFRTRTCIEIAAGGELALAAGVFLNDGANIYCARQISIGSDTRIADWCVIYDTDFHRIAPESPIRSEPVIIGRNVWIGSRVMILAGANIGDHSVIAAGSVVRNAIPPKTLAAGNPARAVAKIDCPDDWTRD